MPQIANNLDEKQCIILTGMPGAGKSTIGFRLAQYLDWAFMDSDLLIESIYACKLQNVVDLLDRDKFLDMESDVICSVQANRTVLATGGSAIYREKTMQHLKKLGHIVFIDVSMPILLKRIANNPERGVVSLPKQSFESLFQERNILYNQYAEFSILADTLSVKGCCEQTINIIGIQDN